MKKSFLLFGIALFTLLQVSSCSKNDSVDAPEPTPKPTPIKTEGSWKMNSYTFERRTSFQTLTSYTNGNLFTQVNVDSKITSGNGNFKSCNVVFWFNTQSTGIYTAKSVNTLASNTTLNYMNVKCMVTDAAGKGAIYESVDSSVELEVKKEDGKFVISGPKEISLTKTLDDGLANAPATMTFTCDKVK